MNTPDRKAWHDNLPFPKHWLIYIALKIIVIVVAVYAALHWKGLL